MEYKKNRLEKFYYKNQKTKVSFYNTDVVTKFKLYFPNLRPVVKGCLKIYWVGASKAQDESGFIQALCELGDVTCFVNTDGEYGPLYNKNSLSWKQVRSLNDCQLLKKVKEVHAERPIDLVIGQMWAHIFSQDALMEVKNLGIPVINISMDDKLPELWGYKNKERMGAVGLGKGVDLTLTTTREVMPWYANEDMLALFWPLASDPQLFSGVGHIKKDIEVLFIGNRYGVRGEIIEYLNQNGIQVTCYGNGWQNGYASAEMNIELSKRAKIILGFGTIAYSKKVYTLKLRDFDALMTGALYITHRNPDLLALFEEGVHLECYETKEELLSKLKYYLVNSPETAAIGLRGQNHAIRHHTWKHRLQSTFEDLGFLSKSDE